MSTAFGIRYGCRAPFLDPINCWKINFIDLDIIETIEYNKWRIGSMA